MLFLNSFRRPGAFFLSVFFILSQSISAATISPSPEFSTVPSAQSASSVSIPDELGKIEEYYSGRSGKTILYIQDAHTSLEAQEHIAKLIDFFVQTKGLRTVYEEGAQGKVGSDAYFKSVTDPVLRQKISYYLLDRLRIGGAEYAHLNRKTDFELIGADRLKLHQASIAAYRYASSKRAMIQRDLEKMQALIAKIIQQALPAELKQWIRLKSAADEQKVGLLDYAKRTKELFPKEAQDNFTENYPHLQLLLDASARIPEKQDSEALKTIHPEEIYGEIRAMEKSLAGIFCRDERQRQIFHYFQSLELLKRLARFEVGFREFEALKTTFEEFNTEKFTQFVVGETHFPLVLSKGWERYLKAVMQFYELAEARDQAVSQAMDDFVKKNAGEKMAVLVFGGFHREGIRDLLRARDISYVIITPRISARSPRHEDYYKTLMGLGYRRFQETELITQATTPPRDLSILSLYPGRQARFEAGLTELTTVARKLMEQGFEASPDEINLGLKTIQAQTPQPAVARSEERTDKKKAPKGIIIPPRMPLNFGLNLKRKIKESPILVQDVWGGKKQEHFKRNHDRLRSLLFRYRSMKRSQYETRIAMIVEAVKKMNPNMTQVQVNLGENLMMPMIVKGNTVTLDMKFLQLHLDFIQALLEYGSRHIQRMKVVAHRDRVVRELVAYFDGARDYLPLNRAATEKLKTLESALEAIKDEGWDISAHKKYLQGLRTAARDKRFKGLMKAESGVQPQSDERALSFRRTLRRILSRKEKMAGRFFAEDILKKGGEAAMSADAMHAAALLYQRFYLEPTFEEVTKMQAGTVYSPSDVRQMLHQNWHVLLATRCYGSDVLSLHLRYLSHNEFIKRLKGGKHAPLARAASQGDTREDRRFYESELRSFDLLSRFFGKEFMARLLSDARKTKFSPQTQDDFFSMFWRIWTSLMEDEFGAAVAQLIADVEKGELRDGVRYLQTGVESGFMLQFLDRVRSLDGGMEDAIEYSDSIAPQEKPACQRVRARIIGKIISDWGIAVAPLLRVINLKHVMTSDQIFARITQLMSRYPQVLADAAAKILEQPDVFSEGPLEAALLVYEYLKPPVTPEFRRALTTWVETQLSAALSVPLYDESANWAPARAAFRYLARLKEPEDMRALAWQMARSIPEIRGSLAHAALPYETIMLASAESAETSVLAKIGQHMLGLYFITDEDSRKKIAADLIESLKAQSGERRSEIIEKMIPNAQTLNRLIDDSERVLKAYLLSQMEPKFIARLLDELEFPVDVVRAKLRGIGDRTQQTVVKELKYARPVKNREIYEAFVAEIPDEVEDYTFGGKLPNYYRILGVPRTADQKMIEQSYRLLALIYHTDLFMHEPEAERERANHQMRLLAEAFGVLNDAAKRLEYDENIPHDTVFYPQKSWLTLIHAENRSEAREPTEMTTPHAAAEGSTLPAVVQSALIQTGQEITDPDRRYLARVLASGTRSEREVALAITEAANRGMAPTKVLQIAERHQMSIPLTGQVIDIVEEQGSTVHNITKWMKQAQTSLRGAKFEGEDAEDFWRTASKEDKVQAMSVAWQLRAFIKERKEASGASQFLTVRKLFRLYQAIGEAGSIDGVEECVDAILRLPPQEDEQVGFIYWKRYQDLLGAVEEAGGLFFDPWNYLANGRFPPSAEELEAAENELADETDQFVHQLTAGNTYHYAGRELEPHTSVSRGGPSVSSHDNAAADEAENPINSDLTELLDVPRVIQAMHYVPTVFFFPYEEIKQEESILKKVLIEMAYQIPKSSVRLIVYGADISDENLKPLRKLGIITTSSNLAQAHEDYRDKKIKHIMHISGNAEYLKQVLHEPKLLSLRHFLLAEESEIWAACLQTLADSDEVIQGISNENGYYEVVGAFLRSEVRRYQASLVVKMAA